MAPKITEIQRLAQGRKMESKRKEKQVAPALRATGQLGKAKPKPSKFQIHAIKFITSPEISFALLEQGKYVLGGPLNKPPERGKC